MKNVRKKVMIFVILCVICLIAVIIFALGREKGEERVPFSPILQEDIKTVEQLCQYYQIELIESQSSSDEKYNKQIYVKFPYDTISENGTSSRNFYEEVIATFAKIYGYENLLILDDEKALKIEVICNKTSKIMDYYTINGDKNYFNGVETKLNLAKITQVEIKDLEVESKILQSLIQNGWDYHATKIGTKDSTLDGYDIYFDEGIEIKSNQGKVFNIVFTDRYKEQIIKDIHTETGLDKIKEIYGASSYQNLGNMVAYKTKDFYIFFNGTQISVYPVVTYQTDEFAKLVTTFIETRDEKKFVEEIKKVWSDFDSYKEERKNNSIELTYTLKGVKFNINTGYPHGITLYNNFSGKITNDVTFEQVLKLEKKLPDYVTFQNKDLVVDYEIKRSYSIHNPKFNYEDYEYRYKDALTKKLDILYSTEQGDFVQRSSQFFCKKDNGVLQVFSVNNEYPPIEINQVYTSIWANDTNLIYSIYKKGIYVYNALTRETKAVIEGEEPYKVKKYSNGILEYDKQKVELNIT